MIAFTLSLMMSRIDDAMILQLGANDQQKREMAASYLRKKLQDTDGCRNYPTLLKIKAARESSNPEIKTRVQQLYTSASARYFGEHPYICVYFGEGQATKENWGKVKRIAGPLRPYVKCWGNCADGLIFIMETPKMFNSELLERLKSHKEVKGILPIHDTDQPYKHRLLRRPTKKR